ncbi:MAG: hypothetical protein AUH85_15635 [Chloroflexi bacterium 13_1_40CM_4_68_4]|nr:MAG: hypothetical protein AUH85_15635 [Chloroflexi bacterium 13_1_40CM_4_68_4]
MRYRCRVGTTDLQLEVDSTGRLTVDGSPLAADVEGIAPDLWSVIIDGRSHEVAILERDPLRVRIDGIDVEVDLVDERTRAAAHQSGSDTRAYEVRAPMPGLIVAVHVREGDLVDVGGSICTLEAMKMDNELTAPRRARIATLRVSAGAKVSGGELLAILAPE